MTSKEALEKLVYLSTTNEEKPNWLIPEIAELNKVIKQDLEVLEILKHYAVNDGWSNGWVIHFWEMNSKELEKVKEVFENE